MSHNKFAPLFDTVFAINPVEIKAGGLFAQINLSRQFGSMVDHSARSISYHEAQVCCCSVRSKDSIELLRAYFSAGKIVSGLVFNKTYRTAIAFSICELQNVHTRRQRTNVHHLFASVH